MVAVSDRILLEQLDAKVHALTRLVRRQAVVIDAMREAWMLPPVGVLLAERRAVRQAEGTEAPPPPAGARIQAAGHQPHTHDPDAETSRGGRAHRTSCRRAAELGRKAAAQGLTADDCPYKPMARAQRKAWLKALGEARAPVNVETANG